MREPKWVAKLEEGLKNSKVICKSDLLRFVGLNPQNSGNFQTLDRWIQIKKLDASHLSFIKAITKISKEKFRGGLQFKKFYDDKEVFSKSSKVSVRVVRNRFREKFEYKCQLCGNVGIHNRELLNLHMDHIDGDRENNEIGNLRWLCPNCHSQTKTYCRTKEFLNQPTKQKYIHLTKIDWPEPEKVYDLALKLGIKECGRRLGVTDNTVRKFLKKNNLIIPKYNFQKNNIKKLIEQRHPKKKS